MGGSPTKGEQNAEKILKIGERQNLRDPADRDDPPDEKRVFAPLAPSAPETIARADPALEPPVGIHGAYEPRKFEQNRSRGLGENGGESFSFGPSPQKNWRSEVRQKFSKIFSPPGLRRGKV